MWFKLAPDAWQALGLTALVLLVLAALVRV